MVKNQPSRETLEQRVLRFIRENHLISGQTRLLVAVSGGPDSVCLLDILSKIQGELGVKLHIAHLNHQLRGAESEADAQFVAKLANRMKIPATIDGRNVRAYQTEHHISLEEAAREVRYAFLAEVAKSVGTDLVAVGHTTNDHIETILMHLIRGTGTGGLRGLQPIRGWHSGDSSLIVIRPLLQIRREETEAYCASRQLSPRLDTTNLSLHPLRNKVRLQLLPLLQSYNSQVVEALLRTARMAGDEISFLNRETTKLWDEIARRQGNTITMDKKKFLDSAAALQRYLLRTAIEELLGTLKDIESRHIEEMIAALTKPAGKSLNLPEGLVFSTGYNSYTLSLNQSATCPFPALELEHELKIPGITNIPGWRIKASIFNKACMTKRIGDFMAQFDFDRVGEKLIVRRRRRGDRFQPLGMEETKKLGQFMIDAKIPRAWRDRVPIVSSREQVLWVVGWRIYERAKITDKTMRILILRFEKAADS